MLNLLLWIALMADLIGIIVVMVMILEMAAY